MLLVFNFYIHIRLAVHLQDVLRFSVFCCLFYKTPQPTREFGERRELPQRGPGRSPDRQRIFGIFEAHRTLKPQALRPNKASYFSVKNPPNRRLGACDDWGHASAHPLAMPLHLIP